MKKLFKLFFASYLYHLGDLKQEINRLKQQHCIIGVYGHEIGKRQFEKYIKWLLKHGFEFATLQDVIDFINGESKIDTCKVWISLDDGWRSNLELIPIIEKYKVNLTLFIPTYPIETGFFRDTLEHTLSEYLPVMYKKDINSLMQIPEEERWSIDKELYIIAKDKMQREAMTEKELKKLAQHPLISIGAHTHTHPMLTKCRRKKILDEVNTNLNSLENLLRIKPSVLAFPNGDYNNNVCNIIGETEIKYMASIKPGKLVNGMSNGVIPRNGIAKASFYENCCRMLDFWYPNVDKLNTRFKS